MTKLTLEEIQARIDAAAAKRPKREKINNSTILKDNGLSIIHFGSHITDRPMTVAYQRINKSHLKIATSVCHKHDTFCKKIGTKTAVNNFLKGNNIVIPIDKDNSPTRLLSVMFLGEIWPRAYDNKPIEGFMDTFKR